MVHRRFASGNEEPRERRHHAAAPWIAASGSGTIEAGSGQCRAPVRWGRLTAYAMRRQPLFQCLTSGDSPMRTFDVLRSLLILAAALATVMPAAAQTQPPRPGQLPPPPAPHPPTTAPHSGPPAGHA